jgi:hypothetical protein
VWLRVTFVFWQLNAPSSKHDRCFLAFLVGCGSILHWLMNNLPCVRATVMYLWCKDYLLKMKSNTSKIKITLQQGNQHKHFPIQVPCQNQQWPTKQENIHIRHPLLASRYFSSYVHHLNCNCPKSSANWTAKCSTFPPARFSCFNTQLSPVANSFT